MFPNFECCLIFIESYCTFALDPRSKIACFYEKRLVCRKELIFYNKTDRNDR